MKGVIDVAAAAIISSRGEVLIAKRLAHLHQGDRWEFPGGKLEAGEHAEKALVRELQEELGITATRFRPLITVNHDYGDKAVRLHVFRVEAFEGVPRGQEGQPLAWVAPSALHQYEFPAANMAIVTAVQLPSLLLVTPEASNESTFLLSIERACAQGIQLIQFRSHSMVDDAYRALARSVHAITAQAGCDLILNRKPAVVADLPCEGWHWSTSWQAEQIAIARSQRPRWLSVACHSPSDIAFAQSLGADFLLLSPVKETASHPGAQPLGWPQFGEWALTANRPVFALGGLTDADLPTSWQHGAQGIAAVSSLWPR